MSVVVALPTLRAVDEAWEKYSALMRLSIEDHTLLVDRAHQEQVALAWREWSELFFAWGGRA